jgi:hypothetical protein
MISLDGKRYLRWVLLFFFFFFFSPFFQSMQSVESIFAVPKNLPTVAGVPQWVPQTPSRLLVSSIMIISPRVGA